jgi:hypothetical protein
MEKTLFFTFFATAALPEYNVNGNIMLVQGTTRERNSKNSQIQQSNFLA